MLNIPFKRKKKNKKNRSFPLRCVFVLCALVGFFFFFWFWFSFLRLPKSLCVSSFFIGLSLEFACEDYGDGGIEWVSRVVLYDI